MTYLELFNNFILEYRIAGGGRELENFDNLPPRLKVTQRHINRAYQQICNKWFDWTFLNVEIDFLIPANTDKFDSSASNWRTDMEVINRDAMFIRDAVNRSHLENKDWTAFRHMRATTHYQASTALPYAASVDPGGAIHFYPPCDHDAVLNLSVKLKFQSMTLPTDVPVIPESYLDTLMYRAAMHHYTFEDAINERMDAKESYEEALTILEAACLPNGDGNATASDESPLVMVTE